MSIHLAAQYGLNDLLSPEMTGSIATVSFFASVLIISLAAVISKTVIKVRRDANATALKQDMLDRGMSADEIKTVLEAGTTIKH
jgi:hypothetical protein